MTWDFDIVEYDLGSKKLCGLGDKVPKALVEALMIFAADLVLNMQCERLPQTGRRSSLL